MYKHIEDQILLAAITYEDALDADRLPLKAVMRELGLTKPTASRRVRAAKDAGLIAARSTARR